MLPKTTQLKCKSKAQKPFLLPQKSLGKNAAQSSLEYLITYGWALILIATIIGVLVIIIGSGVSKESCQTTMRFLCKGNAYAEGDTLFVKLQNATGYTIRINPFTDIAFNGKTGYAVIVFQGTEYRFANVTIPKGQEFTIKAKGMALATDLTITYYAQETGMTYTDNKKIGTNAPENTELSNDGENNDSDPAVDCRQTGVTGCEYLAEPTGASPTTPCTDTCTFTIGPAMTSKGTPIGATGAGIPFWNRSSVTLVFYVESVAGGTTAYIAHLGQISAPPQVVGQGWNVITINLLGTTYAAEDNLGDVSLTADGSFTVLRDEAHKPKVLVNLN